MRADSLKMNLVQLHKFIEGGQEIGFKIPHLPSTGPLAVITDKALRQTINKLTGNEKFNN